MMKNNPYKVLFVCLGNICRSPAGENIFRHVVTQAGLEKSIKIDSAGTLDWHAGKEPDRRMCQTLRDRNISASGKARQFTAHDFHEFDLILTMNHDNYRNVTALDAGINTLLNDNWALRTAVRYQYNSTPALGSESGDTLLSVGLRYALGGFPEPTETLKSDESAPEAIQMGWSSSAALTLSLAEGNADSLTAGINFDTAYRTEKSEFFFNGIYTYAEADGARSADSFLANAQYNRLLNERAFVGFGSGFLRNELADVSYRITPRVILGYYLIKKDDMTLGFEGGPGYTIDKVGGETGNYFSIVAAEKFVWEIGDSMTLKQSVVAIASPFDSENYNLQADILLDTKITKNLSWRVAASWTYPIFNRANLKFLIISDLRRFQFSSGTTFCKFC